MHNNALLATVLLVALCWAHPQHEVRSDIAHIVPRDYCHTYAIRAYSASSALGTWGYEVQEDNKDVCPYHQYDCFDQCDGVLRTCPEGFELDYHDSPFNGPWKFELTTPLKKISAQIDDPDCNNYPCVGGNSKCEYFLSETVVF
jgi:hypothetical protein